MTEKIEQASAGVASVLNAELDTIVSRRIDEIMAHRFVAISVAAMQDTEETRKERITQENIYWSPAYADMCRKVDELINARIEIEKLRKTIKNEADEHYKLALHFYELKDFFRANQHKECGNRLMNSI